MNKLLCCLLAFIICFTFPVTALASEYDNSENNSNQESTPNENLLHQQLEEINCYLEDHSEPVDIKEQTISYTIPLSDGSVANYTLEIVPAEVAPPRSIFDAKVGTWLFHSYINLPLHGEITVTTTVNITYVPSGPGQGFPQFTAYGGTVKAVPIQFTSIDGSYASTSLRGYYVTSGYVGFNCAGVTANVYFDQSIAPVNNTDSYDKIQCVISYTL